MPKYLVKQGLEYPPNRVVLAGEIVDDIPSRSIKWLREQGIIEPADANAKAAAEEPVVEEPIVEETPVVEEVAVVEAPEAEEPQEEKKAK
jgi:hypothetical protein